MSSLKRHEGYLLLDHRSAPGISDAQALQAGLPAFAGRGLFEAPTYTCSHCQKVVVVNPLRNRERAYCGKCDHHLCDECGAIMAATKQCKPFKQIMDEVQEKALKQEQSGSTILLSGDHHG